MSVVQVFVSVTMTVGRGAFVHDVHVSVGVMVVVPSTSLQIVVVSGFGVIVSVTHVLTVVYSEVVLVTVWVGVAQPVKTVVVVVGDRVVVAVK